jgi:hypothetical protein
LSERCQVTVEVEQAVTEGLPETSDELAAKDAAKHVDREKKTGA